MAGKEFVTKEKAIKWIVAQVNKQLKDTYSQANVDINIRKFRPYIVGQKEKWAAVVSTRRVE